MAAKGSKGPYKSAWSGKFVTKGYAKANPGKTYALGKKR
jgi:hypothetical protein